MPSGAQRQAQIKPRKRACFTGFALIWHIWWMAGVGLLGAFAALLVFAFRDEDEVEVPAEQIARFEQGHPAEVVL